MTTVQAITFDLDNTLWETDNSILKAEAKMKKYLESVAPQWMTDFSIESFQKTRASIVRERPEIAHKLGEIRKLTLQHWFLQKGAQNIEASRLAKEGFEVFYLERQDVKPYPGTDETLEILARKFPLAVITNGNADVLSMPIGRHFQFALMAQDFHSPKPDPVMFEEALKRLQCKPEECLHVGDDLDHDVGGASKLGIKTVWINNKNQPTQYKSQADYSIKTLPELVTLII